MIATETTETGTCRYCGAPGTHEVRRRASGETYWTCSSHKPTGAGAEVGNTPSSYNALGPFGRWLRRTAGL